jgi:hypothetical protein
MTALAAQWSQRAPVPGGACRRLLVTLFAFAAILLCGLAIHASGGDASQAVRHADGERTLGGQLAAMQSSVVQTSTQTTAAGALQGAHAVAAASSAPPAEVAAVGQLTATMHPNALELACLLVLLTAAVLLAPRVLAGMPARALDAVVSRIDPSGALPQRRALTLQELSISRT